MPTTRATELAQVGSLVTADPSTSTVTVGGTLTATAINPNNTGFRNRIINGDMRIDQRNSGAAVTLISSGIYTVDRWLGVEATDGAMTSQQSTTAPTGFTNSLVCTTTTADATLGTNQYTAIYQHIEGFNVADLGWGTANAKTITLSFWVRSSLTGTFGGAIRNSAGNRSYTFNYSISVADTWEQKTITITGDTSGTWLTNNGIGISIWFGLGAESNLSGTAGAWNSNNNVSATGAVSVIGTLNATFYLTGVQLEAGSTATEFERRPYGTELALCQRYYYKRNFANGTYVGQLQVYGADTAFGKVFSHIVPMRVAPTSVGASSTSHFQLSNNSANFADCTVLSLAGSEDGITTGLAQRTGSGLTGGDSTVLRSNSNSAFIEASAEL